jgi:hypothetical protein
MSTGKFFKCACGGMAALIAGELVFYGHHQGCIAPQLCVLTSTPPEQQHGPENDNGPGGSGERLRQQASTSYVASMSSTNPSAILSAIAARLKFKGGTDT